MFKFKSKNKRIFDAYGNNVQLIGINMSTGRRNQKTRNKGYVSTPDLCNSIKIEDSTDKDCKVLYLNVNKSELYRVNFIRLPSQQN